MAYQCLIVCHNISNYYHNTHGISYRAIVLHVFVIIDFSPIIFWIFEGSKKAKKWGTKGKVKSRHYELVTHYTGDET